MVQALTMDKEIDNTTMVEVFCVRTPGEKDADAAGIAQQTCKSERGASDQTTTDHRPKRQGRIDVGGILPNTPDVNKARDHAELRCNDHERAFFWNRLSESSGGRRGVPADGGLGPL